MPEGGAWRLVRRLAGVVAKVIAIVVAIALLSAATYEQIGAWRDGRVLQQVGRSVDIGGRTLNINCTGEGSPTVILDALQPGWEIVARVPPAPANDASRIDVVWSPSAGVR